MPACLMPVVLVVAVTSALAIGMAKAEDGPVGEDRSLGAPIAPENPGGPKPVLRDCKVTTTRSKGADGEEIATAHRTCRWAIPPDAEGR